MPYARVAVAIPIWPLDSIFDYSIPKELEEKITTGSLVEINFARRKTWGLVLEITQTTEVPAKAIKEISDIKYPTPLFDDTRINFLKHLSQKYFYPLGETVEGAIPAAIRTASQNVLAKVDYHAKKQESKASKPTLTSEQQEAYDKILSLENSSHLLWGVTGSGKTEIYLRVIEHFLAQGKGALVLVPEISLTPQLLHRFEERFPGEVALFHSQQKNTTIRKDWLATLHGEKRIVIGARSALFAPVQNLGIVIVDEEHEGSFKQEERLRYHAREEAQELARLYGIPAVLGTATPSSETLYQVLKGDMSCTKLENRAVENATLPTIEIVDLKDSFGVEDFRPENPHLAPVEENSFQIKGDFFLSPTLRSNLEKVLANKEQAILFLNRRGLGSHVLCQSCGHILMCPSCEISLTPHQSSLLCHYCGFGKGEITECPGCKKQNPLFIDSGIGTQRIEEALHFHFPEAKVLRLDQDTTQKRGAMEEILSDFKEGNADILLGTQMVAKGHDFPDVTLVGILHADQSLGIPDFRTYEKSLQLLMQVAGRAGRGEKKGHVVMQTFQPEHPLFLGLKDYEKLEDYSHILEMELEKRKQFLYPPFNDLCLLKFDSLDLEAVKEATDLVGASLSRLQGDQIQILGPVPSMLKKIRNRHRWQILIKSKSEDSLEKTIEWILKGWMGNKLERKYKTRLIVDRNPYSIF